jgi:serine/threonine protein kinase
MPLSLDQFSTQLNDSGVISSADLASYIAQLPAESKPRDGEQLAKRLVKDKRISAYQAQVVYSGKGKTLTMGSYFVLDKLGQGGMGMVLKAEHRMMKRLVAVKVLSPSVTKTKDMQLRFQREVEAAARLTHPNIVGAFDAGEINGSPFLVMEYVPGDDLSSIVKKKGPLSVDQAIDCLIQAARGLEFAHKQGVVHRDIKPANLLFDTKGTVKILDMGLARIEATDVATQADLTGTGAVMGTVDYMAPEQAISTKHADARSDLYSLGISLWFLLTGKPAYDGDSLMSRLLAHREQPIPRLRSMREDVPESLETVFQKLVAKKPVDRYQSATELISDLGACRTGASVRSLSVVEVESGMDELQNFLHQIESPTQGPRGSSTSPSMTATKTRVRSESSKTSMDETLPRGEASETLSPTRLKRAREKSKHPAWWRDVRVQFGAGAIAVVLLGAFFLFPTPQRLRRNEVLDSKNETRVQETNINSNSDPVSALTTSSSPGTDALVSATPDVSRVRWPFDPDNGSDYGWDEPRNLGPAINTRGRELNASLTDDEKTIVYSSGKQLMIGERAHRDEPFVKTVPLPDTINRISGLWENSCLSGDGLQLAFIVREGGDDVWLSRRMSRSEPFGTPQQLSPPVNTRFPDSAVIMSPDGLTLCITSPRPGKFAGSDGYLFTRSSASANFDSEQNLGRNVNTKGFVVPNWISNDRRFLLATIQASPPFQTSWHARSSESEPFGDGQPLGPPFDHTQAGGARLSQDGQRIYFHSRELDGGQGDLDLWVSARTQARPPRGRASNIFYPANSIANLLTSSEYTWTKPENLGPSVNGNHFEEHPELTTDGLRLWHSGGGELWLSMRKSLNAPWEKKINAGNQINDHSSWDSAPALSADALTLVFASDRGTDKKDLNLWMCTRSKVSEPFSPPIKLSGEVNTSTLENSPALSADGLTLVFMSARSSRTGGSHLWQATRENSTADFGNVKRLGPVIDSSGRERSPYLSSDGLVLLFESSRAGGAGASDLYLSTRPSTDVDFGIPVSLGPAINTEHNEQGPCLSKDGRTLLFYSTRPGGQGQADIWMSLRVPVSTR